MTAPAVARVARVKKAPTPTTRAPRPPVKQAATESAELEQLTPPAPTKQPAAKPTPAPKPTPRTGDGRLFQEPKRVRSMGKGAAVADGGAGVILGFLVWTNVVLPYFQKGGWTGVKNQLRAKFFNKDAKGNWLP